MLLAFQSLIAGPITLRFGKQANADGSLRFGSPFYTQIVAASGAGVTDSDSAPTAIVGTGGSAVGAGVTDIASAPVSAITLRFGNQNHPFGGLRFGQQFYQPLAPYAVGSGAGVAETASAPTGTGVGYAFVTFTNPIDTSMGSIAWASGGTCVPVAGATMRYPTGVTVYANGDVDFASNNASYTCFYNDGSGEVAVVFQVAPIIVASSTSATVSDSAPTAAAGGAALATGAGITDADTAPQANASASATASGSGVTETDSAPTGVASNPGAASGAGVTDNASAPTGTASATTFAAGAGIAESDSAPAATAQGAATASAAGITDSDAAATATGTGGAAIAAAGTTDTDSAPQALGQGAAAASGAGLTDSDNAPAASAGGGSTASGAGITDNDTAPAGSAAGAAAATGAGITDTDSAPQANTGVSAVATGAGVTEVDSAPTGAATGVTGAPSSGVTELSTAPTAAAAAGAHVSALARKSAATTSPTASAAGGVSAIATGAGVTDTASAPAGGDNASFQQRIQRKIYAGYAKAAQRLGPTYQHYRPSSPKNPISPPNALASMNVSFNAQDMTYKRPSIYGKPLYYALLDGAQALPGDYFVGADGVYFIAGMQPLAPILAVHCTRTINIFRPQRQAAAGLNTYGGTIDSNQTELMTAWPASILQGTKGEKDGAVLPGDVRLPWWSILVPAYPGVTLRSADIITDEINRRYVISSAELTELGWRVTAMQAQT